MELYRSNYMVLNFFAEQELFVELWFSTSEKMSDEMFKREMLTVLKMMKIHKPTKYLVNTKDFLFAIHIDLQEWLFQNYLTHFEELGILKAAFVMSKEFIVQLAIEQSVDEDVKELFQRNYFATYNEALKWLNS